MAHPPAYQDAPMSPLSESLNDDLLAALDLMLSVTPEASPLNETFAAEALAVPPVPTLYDEPIEDRDPLSLVYGPPRLSTNHTEPHERDTRVTPYPKAKPHRRKRPKDELNYLRATVANLEDVLLNLIQSSERLFSVSKSSDEMVARWKQIADRQREEANKAVAENLKLRAMLKGQLDVARHLEGAITEQQNEWLAPVCPYSSVKTELFNDDDMSKRPHAPSIPDDFLFAELNGALDAQYAQVDATLDASGLTSVNYDLLSNTQLKQDAKGIAFAHKEVRLLPFSMLTVARVMWSCSLFNSKGLTSSLKTRVVDNDHLNATFEGTIQFPKSCSTKVCTRIAVRRYFEKNRVVIVWSGCREIAGSVFVRLREKGVNAISNFDFFGCSDGVSLPGSIVRSVVDIKPERVEFKTGIDTKRHFEDMTDLVLGTYHRNFSMFNQVMDNLLVNDLVGSSHST